MNKSTLCAALLLTLLIGGCTLHRAQEDVALPELLPETFSSAGHVTPPDKWWQSFDNSQLNQLIEEMLAANLDMRVAWARLEQANAVAVQAGSRLFPEVSGSFTGSRAKTIQGPLTNTGNFFDIGLSASYEIDLWKALSSGRRASELDREAVREDLEATAIALTAAVTRTWLAILEQRETISLLKAQGETNRQLLRVLEIRFGNARSDAVSIYQQRAQSAAIDALIPLANAQMEVLEHQLSILLGRSPTDKVPLEGQLLPQLPPLPQLGIPLDVIRQRPDIRAAVLRVGSADHRIAAAVADQYPALRLTGGLDYQSDDIADLFSDWVWNLAAAVTAPLFDGKRRKAEVNRTRAVFEQQLTSYEQAVLNAIGEVEDALVREARQKEYLVELQHQLDAAKAGAEAAQARYTRGVGDFLNVLTSNQSVQTAQQNLVSGRRALLGFRIDLYEALGGTWTSSLAAPVNQTASGVSP